MTKKVFAATYAAMMLLSLPAAYSQTTSTQTSTPQTTTPLEQEPAPLFQMHYENRVRSFKEQNQIFHNVVLLGDSITEGFDVTKYLPGQRVLNRGIGADVIGNELVAKDKRGILKRLDESVFDCSPAHLFILIGINDLGQGHSPATLEAGYRDMLTRIRERLPTLNIYVQSVLPCRDRFAKHNENVLDINRRLVVLANEFDCEYIDLHKHFADANGELKDEYTNDGLHLTPLAYKIWADIVKQTVGWDKSEQ